MEARGSTLPVQAPSANAVGAHRALATAERSAGDFDGLGVGADRNIAGAARNIRTATGEPGGSSQKSRRPDFWLPISGPEAWGRDPGNFGLGLRRLGLAEEATGAHRSGSRLGCGSFRFRDRSFRFRCPGFGFGENDLGARHPELSAPADDAWSSAWGAWGSAWGASGAAIGASGPNRQASQVEAGSR